MSDDLLAAQVMAALGAVPDVGDCFQVEGIQGTESYRVDAWMRRRAPRKPDPDPRLEEMLAGLEVKYPRTVAGPDRVPLEFCTREQAEYVGAVGRGGRIVRCTDVVVTHRVNWDPKHIEEHRHTANLLAGEPLN